MDKLIKFDLQAIRGTAPNVVILDIGSNDLCDEKADPDTVALSIRLKAFTGQSSGYTAAYVILRVTFLPGMGFT